jgi:signal transduction histidine kinase
MRRAGALLQVRRGPGGNVSEPAHAERAAPAGLGEALLAIMPDGVALLDATGQVERWSQAAEQLTGRGQAWVRRAGFAALFTDAAAVRRGLAAAVEAAGEPVELECGLRHAEGRDLPVRLRAVALPPAPPDVVSTTPRPPAREPGRALLVLLQDLSEVQTIRRRLIETEKLSAMAKIAGSIAHEFRNPLNSLFLSADLLEDELAEGANESVTATLGAVREEVERLNQIITHYLALSKIGGTQRETLDLTRVVAAFVAEQRERAGGRGASLTLQGSRGACLVKADGHQLRRVLLNLLENALDAVESQAATRKGGGRVAISVRGGRGDVRLVVRDNGPGLPASVRERPFEPFGSTKPRGAGLGLYLVREIVSAHGGSISLLDAAGGGTRVLVRLPSAAGARGRVRR